MPVGHRVDPSSGPSDGATRALGDALAAEYAAVWAYGVIGVHLTDAARSAARAAEAAHRSRRDALLLQLAEGAGQVPADRAGYALPYPVTDRATALRLAVEIEERTAGHWRAALPHTTGADRNAALAALTDCALRATRWRRTAGVSPVTVPFPGRPA
ncbi:ferritin-like domain-containing protein [Micromonospora sp. RP3T]|uniref:ferritin-like domain-containing protein n=1 Tax=Micromonospora sp. RP3T TaxID=2135446 RepID=UPI003D758D97